MALNRKIAYIDLTTGDVQTRPIRRVVPTTPEIRTSSAVAGRKV